MINSLHYIQFLYQSEILKFFQTDRLYDLLRDVLAMLHRDDENAGLFGETNLAAGRSVVSRVFDDTAQSDPVDEHPSLPLPAQLGEYNVTRLLGKGSMGAVYHADGPEGAVALKIIHLPSTLARWK